MKEMNDDELQQWFEGKPAQGEPGADDAKAYSALFEALGKEPERGLPYDFSARVMQRVKADVKRRNDLKWNILTFAIFAVILAGIYGLVSIVNPKALPSLLAYKWIFLMVPVLFIAIQSVDQKLVKTNIFRL